MVNYEPTALIAEMRERAKAMDDLAGRIERYRDIIALLEQQLAEKDERIFRLEKLAKDRGDRLRRMMEGEL